MVCLSFDEGFFLRINSEGKFRPCVAISAELNSAIIEHDSFVECALLMIDEYEVENALSNVGIIGMLDLRYKNEILDKLLCWVKSLPTLLRPDERPQAARSRAISRFATATMSAPKTPS